MSQVSKSTWDKLNRLSEEQLDKLADMVGVGMNDRIDGPPLDKDEKVLILSTEPESRILKALKQLKASE
jgi:hypothetical protein